MNERYETKAEFHFTPVPDVLAQDERLGPVVALTYGVIWRMCKLGEKHGRPAECYAKQKTLARKIGVSRRTVLRHIKTLIDEGYIKDLTPDHHRKSHVYVCTDKLQLVIESTMKAEFRVTESHSGKNLSDSLSTMGDSLSHQETHKETDVDEDTISGGNCALASFSDEQRAVYLELRERGVWEKTARDLVSRFKPFYLDLWIKCVSYSKNLRNPGALIAQEAGKGEPPDIPYNTVKVVRLLSGNGAEIDQANNLGRWATWEEAKHWCRLAEKERRDPIDYLLEGLRWRSQNFRQG